MSEKLLPFVLLVLYCPNADRNVPIGVVRQIAGAWRRKLELSTWWGQKPNGVDAAVGVLLQRALSVLVKGKLILPIMTRQSREESR